MSDLLLGSDIASYQEDPDFDAIKAAGHSFVITKVSEGIGYINPHFPRSRSEAHRVGLAVGLYHFAQDNAATKEADYFCDAIGELAPGEFLALDWEIPAKDPVNWCRIFLARVQARTGVKPLLYINQSTRDGFDWSPICQDFGLWLACYDNSTEPVSCGQWPVLAIKQYTNQGSVPGINGSVDLDCFFGSLDELLAYGAQAAPEPSPSPSPAPEPAPAPEPPAPEPAGEMVYGERSDRVLRLQNFMTSYFAAYNAYTPTGFYGDLTTAGLAEFQFRVDIVGGDGRNVGPQTTAALQRFGFDPYA